MDLVVYISAFFCSCLVITGGAYNLENGEETANLRGSVEFTRRPLSWLLGMSANGKDGRTSLPRPVELTSVSEQLQQLGNQRIASAIRDYQVENELMSVFEGVDETRHWERGDIAREKSSSSAHSAQSDLAKFEAAVRERLREVDSRVADGTLGASMAQKLRDFYPSEGSYMWFLRQKQVNEASQRQKAQQAASKNSEVRQRLSSGVDRLRSLVDVLDGMLGRNTQEISEIIYESGVRRERPISVRGLGMMEISEHPDIRIHLELQRPDAQPRLFDWDIAITAVSLAALIILTGLLVRCSLNLVCTSVRMLRRQQHVCCACSSQPFHSAEKSSKLGSPDVIEQEYQASPAADCIVVAAEQLHK